MKKKLLIILLNLSLSTQIFAQAYYMHEAAEDSDGSPFAGIIGAILLFGAIWVIGKCIDEYSDVKKESDKRREKNVFEIKLMEKRLNEHPNKYKYQNNTYWREGYLKAYSQISTSSKIEILYNKTINDLINEYTKLDNYSEKAKNVMRQIGYYQYLEWNNEGLIKEGRNPIQIIDTQCYHMNDTDFERECIKLYGDCAELANSCVIIFEDEEFRIIPYKDRRYTPLKNYIMHNYPERINMANKIIENNDFLSSFFACNLKHLPKAKQMENHGMLEKKILGSYYFALMAYNEDTNKPCWLKSQEDFIMYLGFDIAIYLHKMLRKPLSARCFYGFKIMEKLGISGDEYIKRRRWERKPDGIYNKLFGYLGKDDREAVMTMKLNLGFSFEDAEKEVKTIVWHL